MKLAEILRRLSAEDGCVIAPPTDIPLPASGHVVPNDVLEFYRLAGGASLFEGADYPFFIVPPDKVRPANRVLELDSGGGDISDAWYIIADTGDGSSDYLTIDFDPARLGRCYDSFHETHALVGDTPIIARSFTELLERLLDNHGRYPYWLRDDFEGMGDAYDRAS
jgi:hypothetical protein